MNSSLPEVDDDVLRQRVSHGAYSRGRAYAEEGAVLQMNWDGQDLTASVAGSSPAPYRCRISLVRVGSMWIPMAMGCSCPVRTGCKHAVATLITARDRSRTAPDADWRATLGAVASGQKGAAPLALGFFLRPEPGPSAWQNRLQPVLSAAAAYEQGKRLELHVRPMMRGKSRAWIKGGLTWRGLAYELGHAPEQVMWLRQLLGLYDGTRATSAGVDHEGLSLREIHGPMLWDLFDGAGAAGVEFVPDRGMSLSFGRLAQVHMHAERGGEGLRLRARAEIDGDPVAGAWLPIGDHGIYAYEETASGFAVRIAPTPAPLPPLLGQLTGPVTIPEADEEEFFGEFYPVLRNTITVTADEGVDLPEYRPPVARLTLTYSKKDRLKLAWAFHYFEPRGTFPFGPGAANNGAATKERGNTRDPQWEEHMCESVARAWPQWSELEEFRGVEAAEFTTEILPELEKIEGLEVKVVGTRPNYTRLEGNPHIKVTAVESDRNDWFDLGFEITIEDRQIPFPDLFAALSRGNKKLLLLDRSYLSLEHPAFDDLRELLIRAEDLPEWEPDRPTLSKFQVHVWEEFEDLADETVAARGWREAVAGLRDLEAIEPVAPPAALKAQLRGYQQEGFEWLAFLHRHNLGGILADDMGLGKTLQTLALIAHARESSATAPTHPFLIIAPTSVVATWMSEAAKFLPGLRMAAVTHTRRKRKASLAQVIAGADVVVTSYAIARLDAGEFHTAAWSGLVLDEAQFVKNPGTRLHQEISNIPAPFRLAITGTPMENSLTDLWSLMSITAPGLFASARRFREQFVRPIEKNNDPDRLQELRRLVRPFMLRRTKEHVAPELPPKQEQLLEVELSGPHRKLYDAVLQRERQKVLGLIEDLDKNRFIVFRSLTLLRMLALAPGLIGEEHAHIDSAKLNTLTAHIVDIAAEGHRVLVFSQFTSFLKMAAVACAESGLTYEYLDGSTTNRAKVINSFRAGDAPVFFISLKAGGFGLTLTEADYVFVLDPWWNPAAESQAVDRTHRIGQTRNVIVYRLVAADTIEEKVMALQHKKAALFNAVVDDDAHFSRTLSASDIRGLFEA